MLERTYYRIWAYVWCFREEFKWDFALDCRLSGNEGNSVTEYLHKSSLERWQIRVRPKLSLVKKQQSLMSAERGVILVVWKSSCFCLCSDITTEWSSFGLDPSGLQSGFV